MKKFAALLATVGILATVSAPAMASAPIVQKNAAASSYSLTNIMPEGSYSTPWGTSSLTADNEFMQFNWQVIPNDSTKSYTYNLGIEVYTSGTPSSYVRTVPVPVTTGTGTLGGVVAYPRTLAYGLYYGKLVGSWTASDGSTGTVGNYLNAATTSFLINF